MSFFQLCLWSPHKAALSPRGKYNHAQLTYLIVCSMKIAGTHPNESHQYRTGRTIVRFTRRISRNRSKSRSWARHNLFAITMNITAVRTSRDDWWMSIIPHGRTNNYCHHRATWACTEVDELTRSSDRTPPNWEPPCVRSACRVVRATRTAWIANVVLLARPIASFLFFFLDNEPRAWTKNSVTLKAAARAQTCNRMFSHCLVQ